MFTYYRLNRLRLVLAVVLFASLIFAPWWLTLIFATLLNLRFRAWETIIAGVLMDLYWMPFAVSFFSLESLPLGTITAIVLVFGLEPLRRQLLVGPEIV